MVLLRSRDLRLADVVNVLASRHLGKPAARDHLVT